MTRITARGNSKRSTSKRTSKRSTADALAAAIESAAPKAPASTSTSPQAPASAADTQAPASTDRHQPAKDGAHRLWMRSTSPKAPDKCTIAADRLVTNRGLSSNATDDTIIAAVDSALASIRDGVIADLKDRRTIAADGGAMVSGGVRVSEYLALIEQRTTRAALKDALTGAGYSVAHSK